jgi:predicted transcriptional regulator
MTVMVHDPLGLGRLERRIMIALWNAGTPLKAAEVSTRINYEGAYSTVATVLVILLDKGLVSRQRDSRAWKYEPAISRDKYLAGRVRALLDLSADPEAVIAHAIKP